MRGLRRLGTVTRIGAPGPVASAIAFARFAKGGFGWGVVDPGHGLVFARADRALDAVAAAALSATAATGRCCWSAGLSAYAELEEYLLDIRPGYAPTRCGGLHHGWIVGDDRALGLAAQARIDELLEITSVTDPAARSASPREPAEHPDRLGRDVTVDDIRRAQGGIDAPLRAAIRNRIARLIEGLRPDHPPASR